MSQMRTLVPHPRLYIGNDELARVDDAASHPSLEVAAREVAENAEQWLEGADFYFNPNQHNSLLIRARMMQTRIVTLLVRWRRTGKQRYRDAAIEHVRQMGRWRYWSWITMRHEDDRPEAIFDLSYGENSATLAIAYTLLHATLSEDEAGMFHDMAARRALRPYLAHTVADDGASWWFGHAHSNWNSVCAGGAGMLGLAMYETLDEAPEVVKRTEASMIPFMRALEDSDGAWPEGVGYWNYGMRYAFMYLLSHERATDARHPLMEQPATAATLYFPLDFCPHSVACGFGDVNHWRPLAFHYAAAHRFGCHELIPALDHMETLENVQHWPNAAELLLLHPRTHAQAPPAPRRRVLRRYAGQDWCLLADRWPDPGLYVSIRGGSADVPHGHRDLMSFNVLVGRERLLHNAEVGEYLDTTFSPRRNELFEVTPPAKNALLINGVGITEKSTVKTTTIERDALQAVRIDGTEAMGVSRSSESATDHCLRLIGLLEDDVVVVIDRVALPHPGRLEARYLTPGAIARTAHDDGATTARIDGERERLHAAFACNVPASLHTATAALTSPDSSPPLHMLRWCTRKLHTQMVMAAALCPSGAVAVTLEAELDGDDAAISVHIEREGRRQTVRCAPDLTQAAVIDA